MAGGTIKTLMGVISVIFVIILFIAIGWQIPQTRELIITIGIAIFVVGVLGLIIGYFLVYNR